MNSKHLILIYFVAFISIAVACLLTILDPRWGMWSLSAISFIFVVAYSCKRINEDNPDRFYYQIVTVSTKKQNKRFDFSLVRDILQISFFFTLMLFVILSVGSFLFFDIWPCDLKFTMGIVGFDWIILFTMVMQKTYDFIMDKCEEEIKCV